MHHAISTQTIGGKKLYVFEKHNAALSAWADVKINFGHPFNVITLDHHTDTHSAFCHHLCHRYGLDNNEARSAGLSELVNMYSAGGAGNIDDVVDLIRYDEQIYTAIALGVIDFCYVIAICDSHGSLSDFACSRRDNGTQRNSDGTILFNPDDFINPPPEPERHTYTRAINSKVLCAQSICAVNCHKIPHDDDCIRPHYDSVLESDYLQDKLRQFDIMHESAGCNAAIAHPFVLDVDLDYFHTTQSITPSSTELFYELIRQSIAITIALEPSCVDQLRLDGEDISSDSLLTSIKTHIATALR